MPFVITPIILSFLEEAGRQDANSRSCLDRVWSRVLSSSNWIGAHHIETLLHIEMIQPIEFTGFEYDT